MGLFLVNLNGILNVHFLFYLLYTFCPSNLTYLTAEDWFKLIINKFIYIYIYLTH